MTAHPVALGLWLRLRMLVSASAALCLCGTALAAADIKIGGTGNALGTLRLMATAFNQRNPDVRAVVLASLGTRGAIKAVPKGAIDIGLSSRTLNDDEVKAGAVATEYARSPLVFALAVKSKVTALTLDEVADIYSGKPANGRCPRSPSASRSPSHRPSTTSATSWASRRWPGTPRTNQSSKNCGAWALTSRQAAACASPRRCSNPARRSRPVRLRWPCPWPCKPARTPAYRPGSAPSLWSSRCRAP